MILAAYAGAYVIEGPRLKRDVSELLNEPPSNDYLPPPEQIQSIPDAAISDEIVTQVIPNEEPSTEAVDVASTDATVADTVVFGQQGYEYKTPLIRQLRDVSHLKLGYLPPHHLPSTEYLPPLVSANAEVSTEYLPPLIEKEVDAPVTMRQPSNEYLPPVGISTEDSQSDSVSLSAANLQAEEDFKNSQVETITLTATDVATTNNEALEVESIEREITTISPNSQETTTVAEIETHNSYSDLNGETAIFDNDGYHYKTPSKIPAELTSVIELIPSESPLPETLEYLPPLQNGLHEAEGPDNGESATLTENGYHYRAIKRRF